MHSIKNTIVAVILLGVSYGVYQVITTPESSGSQNELMEMLTVEDNFGEAATDTAIPNQLLGNADAGSSAAEINLPPIKMDNFAGNKTLQDNQRAKGGELIDRTAPPLLDASRSPDKRLIQSLKDEINSSSQLDEDLVVSPPKTNMTKVATKPSTEKAALFDPKVTPASTGTKTLEATWPKIETLVAKGEFRSALAELTSFYRSEKEDSGQRQKLLDWLDLLAAKVVYSSEHHLRSLPYIVQPNDKIAELARQWQIPAQLIYNINRRKIPDPNQLIAGTELKMIQGPFHAEIDTKSNEMTLFVDGLYAGRFSVMAGAEVSAGVFRITDKSAKGKKNMPFWIELSDGLNLYGTDQATVSPKTIGIKHEDAGDVFAIPSASSKVKILR